MMGCYKKLLLQPPWDSSFDAYDHSIWDPSDPLVYGAQRLWPHTSTEVGHHGNQDLVYQDHLCDYMESNEMTP